MVNEDLDTRVATLEKQLKLERDATRQNNIEMWAEVDILHHQIRILQAFCVAGALLGIAAVIILGVM